MSSLWTPSGEHFPQKDEGGSGSGQPPSAPPGSGVGPGPGPGPGPDFDAEIAPSPEAQAEFDEMRRQLANTPAEVVVANHCYGMFELATIYLSNTPPMLFEARLAIDGLGALLDGLKGRLGAAAPTLFEALSQVRLAFVQLEGAERAAAEAAANSSQN
jgi:hypothetical protein